jgi:uncharacterized protein YjbI with pentapeptide repeats
MGTTFQSIITEFENDFTRKILGQTFSDESTVTKELSFTKADFYTNIFDHSYLQKIDSSWSYFGTCSFYETDISDIDFTGTIIDNLTLEETTFSNLKVSENFPVKFLKSEKLTEATDSWSLEKLINLI